MTWRTTILALFAVLAPATVSAGPIPITVDVGTDSGLEISNAAASHDSVRTSSAGRTSGGTSISFELRETAGTPLEAVELSIALTDARAKQRRTLLWEGGIPALTTQRIDLPTFEDIRERIYSAHVRIAAVRRDGVLRPLLPFHGRDVPLSLPGSSPEVSITQAVARLTDGVLFVAGQHTLTPRVDAARLRLVAKGDGDSDADYVEEDLRLTATEPGFLVELRPPEGLMGVRLELERVLQADGTMEAPGKRQLSVELGIRPSLCINCHKNLFRSFGRIEDK